MIGQAERLLKLNKLEKAKKDSRNFKVITFTSGKGGTGKTFISLSIAYALSKLNKKVLFIDLDLNFANSNILLNIIPKASINNFFHGNRLLNEVITPYSSNFYLIFGESGEEEPEELKEESVTRLFNHMNKLKENYDYIIIDTASGGQKGLISLLTFSDANIIVTSPEPTAVMDAYVMVKLLNKENYKGKKLIIVNKCTNEGESSTAYNNIKTASEYFLNEKIGFLGYLDFDEYVYQSITKQELLIAKDPSAKTSCKIKFLAEALSDIIQLANIPHSPSGNILKSSNF
jgi:flagellar biosynthesis protein FlhG